MAKEVEVLEQLFNSMEEAVHKLKIAVNKNDFVETARINKFILDINKKIDEELR